MFHSNGKEKWLDSIPGVSSIPDVSSWLLKLGAIPVDYILEAGDKKIVLPNQPSGVSIVGNHADETIYTFDTKKVIRHRGELRSGQITLTGCLLYTSPSPRDRG